MGEERAYRVWEQVAGGDAPLAEGDLLSEVELRARYPWLAGVVAWRAESEVREALLHELFLITDQRCLAILQAGRPLPVTPLAVFALMARPAPAPAGQEVCRLYQATFLQRETLLGIDLPGVERRWRGYSQDLSEGGLRWRYGQLADYPVIDELREGEVLWELWVATDQWRLQITMEGEVTMEEWTSWLF
jgi:hypothetical protein